MDCSPRALPERGPDQPVLLLSTLLALLPLAQDPLDDTRFFLERVRPVLVEHCFECHGPEVRRAKGGLRLDGAASLASGGASGPAIDAAHPEEGRLLRAIRREDPDQAMPPEEALPAAALAVLEDWVARGAPWAAEASIEVGPEERRFFEERVRPLLAERCFGCHGPELEEVES